MMNLDSYSLYVKLVHDSHNYEPLTDAEIDQLKRGL